MEELRNYTVTVAFKGRIYVDVIAASKEEAKKIVWEEDLEMTEDNSEIDWDEVIEIEEY
jgi:hypothetical protein